MNFYYKCGLDLYNYQTEKESKEYHACRFTINGRHIIYRNGKITPKKIGQFVTFWKRNENNIIEPFFETDPVDFYHISVQNKNNEGQFVFPKALLIKKGIISTPKKEGKRAFRVFPPWDLVTSKQAKQTQNWQLAYFFEINNTDDLTKVSQLFNAE